MPQCLAINSFHRRGCTDLYQQGTSLRLTGDIFSSKSKYPGPLISDSSTSHIETNAERHNPEE